MIDFNPQNSICPRLTKKCMILTNGLNCYFVRSINLGTANTNPILTKLTHFRHSMLKINVLECRS